MSAYLDLNASTWAQKNFKNIDIGDKRRIRRVVNIAECMAISPGKSIPQLFDDVYAIKATYELFKNKQSTPDNLQKGHRALVYEELNKSGVYLLVEDTSALSWSGNAPVNGLGPIGASTEGLQGFLLQSVLAIRWPKDILDHQNISLEILGLADQQYLTRLSKRKKLKRKTARECTDELESKIWERTIERLPSPPKIESIRWVRVCDRGADIYESLIQNIKNNYGFVVRAAQDRQIRLEDGKTSRLFTSIRELKETGNFSLDLRSRLNQPARKVNLSIAFQSVKLNSPQRPGFERGKLPSIECTAVRVWEQNSLEGIECIEWILLCDQKITTFEEALICVQQYSCRWVVEDFHKALKTGLGAEKLQLEEAHRLFAAISIMSIVALRLVDIRERFRINPDNSADKSGLSSLEIKVLEKRLKRVLKTVKDVNLAIGRLGGHMNRKGDGMPGLLTLWRGMQRLTELVEGAQLAAELCV